MIVWFLYVSIALATLLSFNAWNLGVAGANTFRHASLTFHPVPSTVPGCERIARGIPAGGQQPGQREPNERRQTGLSATFPRTETTTDAIDGRSTRFGAVRARFRDPSARHGDRRISATGHSPEGRRAAGAEPKQ